MSAIAWYLAVVKWSVHCLNGKKRNIKLSEKFKRINDIALIRLHGDNIAADIEISSNIGLDADQDATPILYLRFEEFMRRANILLFELSEKSWSCTLSFYFSFFVRVERLRKKT